MKKFFLLFVFILTIFLPSCFVHQVGYFEANPGIQTSKKSNEKISISFRVAVEDSFRIEYDGVPKTLVTEFRRSLASAVQNTFKESFSSIMWLNGFNPEGVSLVFTRVTPNWYTKAESSTGVQYGCEIDYSVLVYVNGAMRREIRKKAQSYYSGVLPTHAVDLLRDGVRSMCQDLYSEFQTEMDRVVGGSGTGFLVSNNGYILTNAHVVESATSIVVKGIRGDFATSYSATVVAEDKPNDLAILKLDIKNDTLVPFPIRYKGVETGEDVFVLGYPLVTAMGEEIKLTKGIVSSKSGFQGSTSAYQISAQVQPGNSGSPVFDNSGNLIGVVNSKIMGAEGVTYVIKPSFIRTLFENTELQLLTPEKNTYESKSLSEKTKIISPFIYIIQVEL